MITQSVYSRIGQRMVRIKHTCNCGEEMVIERTSTKLKTTRRCGACWQNWAIKWHTATADVSPTGNDNTEEGVVDDFHSLQARDGGNVVYRIYSPVSGKGRSYNVDTFTKSGRLIGTKIAGIYYKEVLEFIKKYSVRYTTERKVEPYVPRRIY